LERPILLIAGVRMMHSATTPPQDPSPVELCTTSVLNTTGLARSVGIVVLCIIETPGSAPKSPRDPAINLARPLPRCRLPEFAE
jgi:hypothetical protein